MTCLSVGEGLVQRMVIIRIDGDEAVKRAMDFLVGRCSFKTRANGDLMVSGPALGAPARPLVVSA